jgi:hypothetical protein
VEKYTPMAVEVIDGESLSLGLVTHETKLLDVTISSYTNKVVFNVIPSLKNLSSLHCLGLVYIIRKWIGT